MKKYYLYLSIFLCLTCFLLLLKPASALIDTTKELNPHQSFIEYYEYANTTDPSAVKNSQTHLILYSQPETISFQSEYNCSVFVLNKTEMLNFVNGSSFIAKKTWANVTSIQETITYQELTVDWGADTFIYNQSGQSPVKYAAVYFAVRNEINGSNYASLRVGYQSEFLTFLDDLCRTLVCIMFFYFGMKLIFDARQAKKERQPSKPHIYKNYGIGLIFGGIATGVWEIFHWYARLDPSSTWFNPLEIAQMPNNPIISKNILSFVTFISLGFSLVFISNTVEKMVLSRKVPILTYLLVATEILLISCMFVPTLLIYFFYPWIVTLALAAINIIITYIRVAHVATGRLKQQAINIVITLTAMYLSIALVRILVQPEYIGNIVCIIFMIGLYKSLKIS